LFKIVLLSSKTNINEFIGLYNKESSNI